MSVIEYVHATARGYGQIIWSVGAGMLLVAQYAMVMIIQMQCKYHNCVPFIYIHIYSHPVVFAHLLYVECVSINAITNISNS